jgi:dipeptidase
LLFNNALNSLFLSIKKEKMSVNTTRLWLIFFTGLITFIIPFSCHADEPYRQKLDCFSIVVGKKASADGSVIVAHNEDTGTDLVNFTKVPAADHPDGSEILFETGGKTSQVNHTLGYLWINIPVCDVCDTYINESGVFIGSDGCPSREDQPDLTDGGIVFWLRRILAERAHTAREGVKLAGELIDRYGYASSGRTYIIADANEGWMLAVVNGRHWVASRVPDDEIAVIPNSYTIQEVNLADTLNYLGSPDLVEYAIARGWYNPATDGVFRFARAYSNPGSLTHPDNVSRMWRGVSMLSGRTYSLSDDLPFSFKPVQKVDMHDLMAVLRDHYEGTELDKSHHYTAGNPHKLSSGTICSGGSQYSAIAQLRSWMPVEIGTRVWVAPFRPCIQAYAAWYPCITNTPAIYAKSDPKTLLDRHFDRDYSKPDGRKHAFRVFVARVNEVDEDFSNRMIPAQNSIKQFEKENFVLQDSFEKQILDQYALNPEKAKKRLTDHSNRIAMKICREAGRGL